MPAAVLGWNLRELARDRGSPGKINTAVGAESCVHPLWDPEPERAATWICSITGTAITATAWQRYIPGAAYRPPCGWFGLRPGGRW